MTKLSPLLPCLVFGLAATSAHAQMFYGSGSASGSVTPGTPSSSDFSSYFPSGAFPDDGSLPGSTSGSATFTATGVTAVGSASGSYSSGSGFFGLNASAAAAHNYPATSPNSSFGDFLGYGGQGSSSATATLQVTDLIFSGPSAALPVNLNLLFSGTYNASSVNGGSYGYSYFTIDLAGGSLISGDWRGQTGLDNNGGSFNFGLLGSYAGGQVALQSGVYAVPTGVPLTLSLTLYSYANSSGGYDTTGSGDALATLALPTSGPVFDLPSGFSADSVSLGLVNNAYSPVPEPEQYAALAGLGLLGFALWRRRCSDRPVPDNLC